jgi:tight adherence protein B
MILLGLVFLVILVVVFGIVAFMMRPTPEQTAVHRRIATLIVPQGGPGLVGSKENYALTIAEPKSFERIDKLIGDSKFARKMKLLILQSNKSTSVGAVVITMVGAASIAFLIAYVFTSMLLIAFAAAAIASYLPVAALHFRRSRRIKAFNAILPDCIETCARSLRAGHSIVAAIDIVTELAVEPARTEFGEVFKKQNYGLPLREALMQMLERLPSSDLQVMVTGILVQKDTGGNLAEILDRTAEVIRARIRIQGEIRTHTAQGRMTGWILFLLPVVMMLVINLVNPGYSEVLFRDPFGKKILYAGMILLVIGGFFIRQIVRGIEA